MPPSLPLICTLQFSTNEISNPNDITKISKAASHEQSQTMSVFVENRGDLAKNPTQNSHQGRQQTINNLREELPEKPNSVGPPNKNATDWKKARAN
uniref:Uncharacterized protein n=1 Tax=Glossina palpalis gambiensis TaxID=67801 RepID=A0A1B0B6K7_9MUSC